jgi:hypothetical protein
MDSLRAQTGLSKFKAGLATGGRGSSGGSTVAPQGRQTPFSPPASKGGRPPGVSLKLPEGANPSMFRPGNTINGKVAGARGGQVTLQLGDQMLQAQSRVPLKVGDNISLQVRGQNQGQVHLSVLTSPATKMTMADLSTTLTSMKMPIDAAGMDLAKSMVELKIPLTKENFTMMKQVLAQTTTSATKGAATAAKGGAAAAPQAPQAPLTSKVAATSFLQNSQLPITPQNVTVLSNFLSNNPQIGMQMVTLNTELKKMMENTHIAAKDVNKMIGEVQKGLGKMVMEPPSRNNKGAQTQSPKNLKGMAKQTGIEFNLGAMGYGGGEEWDFAAILQRMRERFSKEGLGGDELLALMKSLEQNLDAQKLINRAKSESNLGYYYLQIPLNPDAAELWLEYTEDHDGNRVVDFQDTRIEFLVNTESMGELHFLVEVRQGKASVFLGTASEEVRRFATPFLPALAERVLAMGFQRGHFRTVFRQHSGKRELVEHTDFEELERYNVQA